MSKYVLELSDAQDAAVTRYGLDVTAIAFEAVAAAVTKAAVAVLVDEAGRQRDRELRPLADTFKDRVVSAPVVVVDPPIDATPADGV